MRRWWLLAALGGAVLLIGSSQEWVGGRVVDPVLGTTTLSVTGTEAGRTLVAGALLAGASVLGGLVGARPVRVVAGLCLLGAAVLTGQPALRSLTDPDAVVADAAASLPAYAGASVVTTEAAGATAWPWLALAGAVLLTLGGLALLVRTVRGTDTARAAPDSAASADRAGAAGTGAARQDAWDELTRGEDPTLED